uniref:Calcineurin-like phosphoesterase domain-containing protein n=1 Tax=Meloidogyne javanica TaxID=6303 RepID=A0A915LNY1_MELJA
ANLAHGGAVNQILAILRVKGSIEAICSNLAVKNNELVANMLEALYVILNTVASNDPDSLSKICERVEECGGLDKIEKLQEHESEQIYLVSYKIIEEFFSDEEDSELAIGMEEQQPQQDGDEKTFRIRLSPTGRISCTEKLGCSYPKAKSLNFVIVGDIGGLPIYPYYSYAQKRVAEAISNVVSEQGEPLNFVINVGDNFYFNGVSDIFDSRFEDSFEQVYDDENLFVPWYTIAGNHDHLGNISAQLAHTNFSSKWTFPHLFYKIRIIFDFQNLTESLSKPVIFEILMIDTIVLCGNTEDIQGKSLFSWMFSKKREPNGPEPKYEKLAKKQWKWIEKQLENSKFVCFYFWKE